MREVARPGNVPDIKVIYISAPESVSGGYCLKRLIALGIKPVQVIVGPPTVPMPQKLRGLFTKRSALFNYVFMKILNILRRRKSFTPRKTERLKRETVVKVARQYHLPVCYTKKLDEHFFELFNRIQPDLILSCFNPLIIPERLINLASIACINVHPSLLPEYAGGSPWFWPIRNAESRSGVTFHHVTPKIDFGDIVLQKAVDIGPDFNIEDLEDLLTTTAENLIGEFIEMLRQRKIPHIPQKSGGGYFPALKDKDVVIDWSKPAANTHNLLRARFPRQPVLSYFKGKIVYIWDCAVDFKSNPQKVPREPGEIVKIDCKGIRVATKDGHVLIKVIGWENGLILPGNLFARTSAVKKGDKMG